MPTFEADVQFEIYCARCGAGICSNGSTSRTYRGQLRLDMEPCEKCIEHAVDVAEDKLIGEYEEKIEELKYEIDELKGKINELSNM